MKVKILSLALLTSALFSTHASAALTTHTLSCKSGKFKGELKYNRFEDSREVVYHLDSYKITRSNGQKGGNKANINTAAGWVQGNKLKTKTNKSPDSMKQDGKWNHRYAQLATTKPGTRREFKVEFIFDKSGPDPRCTAVAYH